MPEKAVPNSDILKQIIDSLSTLDEDSRNRLIKCVITYFDFDGAPPPLDPSNSQPRASQSDREPSFGNRQSLSPKDFLHQKEPKTDVERVTCFAYYLTNYRDLPYFKTEDISKLNTEAAQIKLSNPSLTIANATRAGLLAQAGAGKKQISMHGEKVVLALPDRDRVREILRSIRRRMSKKKNRNTDKSNHAPDTE
jgi:hypothetical protein